MIEIYKAKSNFSPEFMRGVFFENRRNYNLRSDIHMQLPKVVTTRYGAENITYRGYLLWSSLPKEIKSQAIYLSLSSTSNNGTEIFVTAD